MLSITTTNNNGIETIKYNEYRLFSNDLTTIIKYNGQSIKILKKPLEVIVTNEHYQMIFSKDRINLFNVLGVILNIECLNIEITKNKVILEYNLLDDQKEFLENRKLFIEWS